jgi:hypothetical protein
MLSRAQPARQRPGAADGVDAAPRHGAASPSGGRVETPNSGRSPGYGWHIRRLHLNQIRVVTCATLVKLPRPGTAALRHRKKCPRP